MRVFFLKLILFVMVLAGLYLVVAAWAANGSPAVRDWFQRNTTLPAVFVQPKGTSGVRFTELQGTDRVDILFCGSSHCYRTFDTRYYTGRGYTAFNMGSTAQTPLNSYYLLRRHLPRLRPRVLVFEAYWVVFQSDGKESVIDLCGNLPLGDEVISMARSIGSLAAWNAVLLRLLDRSGSGSPKAAPQEDPRDVYIPGGFVERVVVPSEATPWTPPTAGRARTPALREDQLSYFRRILRLAAGTGTRCLVAVQPLPREVLAGMPDRQALMSEIRRVAEEEGVRMIDFNDSLSLDMATYFFDDDHLNALGVELVNREILGVLEEHYLDRTGSTGAASGEEYGLRVTAASAEE